MKDKSLYGIIGDEDTLMGEVRQEKYYVEIAPVVSVTDKYKAYMRASVLGRTITRSLVRGWGGILASIGASTEVRSLVRGKGYIQARSVGSASVVSQLGELAPTFDIDVQNWLDLITDQPSATQNDYVNTMIKDIKEGLGVERMSEWGGYLLSFSSRNSGGITKEYG